MAQITFSVRMDENTKRQLDELCKEFGMTTSTAINLFAATVVRERRIPFMIRSRRIPTEEEQKEAMEVLERIRQHAIENGTADMPLEEINAEIDAYRRGE